MSVSQQACTSHISLLVLYITGITLRKRLQREEVESNSSSRGSASWKIGNRNTASKVGFASRSKLTADRWLDLFGTNNHIMLILLALRIRGSHQSTLNLLKQMNELAVYFLSSVFRWFQQESFYGPGGLAYAHDFLVVNIA